MVTHVVDDDRAESMVEVERHEAEILLDRLVLGLRQTDGLNCQAQLRLGEPFEQIPALAEALGADLVVIGPYRRDRLKNIFIGATAERIIRASPRPVLMANSLPTGPYERILLATDFSPGAQHAMTATKALGLLGAAHTSAAHAYQSPVEGLRASTAGHSDDQEALADAQRQLSDMAEILEVELVDQIAERIKVSAADTIREVAARIRADLVVIGASRRSPLAQAWVSSVAQDLLRFADKDILVVPGASSAT